jgi:hypothetical protein
MQNADRAIQRLAGVLLSPQAPASVLVGGRVVIGARRYRSSTYVIAVNYTSASGTAVLSVPSARRKSAVVWNESRRIRVRRGVFSDRFEPYQVHVYFVS